MSDTFWVDDAVAVHRGGIVASPDAVWTWWWKRPSLPDTTHLMEYDTEDEKWTRGIRTRPGGWVDHQLDPERWPPVDSPSQAEELITALIHREPK